MKKILIINAISSCILLLLVSFLMFQDGYIADEYLYPDKSLLWWNHMITNVVFLISIILTILSIVILSKNNKDK